jgi:hypothetical protein
MAFNLRRTWLSRGGHDEVGDKKNLFVEFKNSLARGLAATAVPTSASNNGAESWPALETASLKGHDGSVRVTMRLLHNAVNDLESVSDRWELAVVPFYFRASYATLGSVRLRLLRRAAALLDPPLVGGLRLAALPPGARGWAFLAQPIAEPLPVLSLAERRLVYVPHQFERRFIDLDGSWPAYLARFSAKTRSTLKRKERKLRENRGGDLDVRIYKTPSELERFHSVARLLSLKTYQDRLLDAGLPDNADFLTGMRALAAADQVRAFLLFYRGRPVSYLYCPARDGILQYQFLGYDPEFAPLSPGTVLQMAALEHLFAERRWHVFDFTEGDGEHKRFFATGSVSCADIYVLDQAFGVWLLLVAHWMFDCLIRTTGRALDRFGLKHRARRLLRGG